jgi:hypothetical protein
MYTTHHVRGEHLLWLTPIIYIWLTSINAPLQNFIVFNDGNFYLFNFFSALIIFLVIVALPFYIHAYLRQHQIRSIVISWLHIAPTLILILAIITIYAYAPPIEISWRFSTLTNPNFTQWQIYNDVAIALFGALLIIQVVFLLYGLIKIYQQKLEAASNEDSDVDSYSFEDNQVMINPAYKYTWIPKPAEPVN